MNVFSRNSAQVLTSGLGLSCWLDQKSDLASVLFERGKPRLKSLCVDKHSDTFESVLACQHPDFHEETRVKSIPASESWSSPRSL